MQCAVTGANGFVGGALMNALLARGWSIRAMSRRHASGPDERGVQWVRGDLQDAEPPVLKAVLDGSDVVFHCASELYDESVMESLHVAGTERLIEAARGRIQHWVHLSSCGVYGPVRDGVITEGSPLRPVSVYEKTKLRSEQIVMQAAEEDAFSAVVLRPSIIYGETMTNQSLRSWVRAVERGLFFFVGQPGAMANYVHVDDVAEALCRCAEDKRAEGRIYNLSAGCAIEEFVHAMCVSLNCREPHIRLPECVARLLASAGSLFPGFPLKTSRVDALTVRTCYSSDRIRNELNFAPRIDAQEGLARLAGSVNGA